MEFKFSRSIQIYFTSVLAILAIALTAGTVYYWNTGALNTENVSAVFEAAIQIDEIAKKNDLGKVRQLVEADRARDAAKILTRLESDVKNINSVSPVPGEEFDKLEDSLKDTKNGVTGLIAVPQVRALLTIFSERVEKFNQFVSDNNWRTLTRVSNRIKSRISHKSIQGPGFFSYAKVKQLKRGVLDDIRTMRQVTEKSVLTTENKNIIYLKLRALKTEVILLDKYQTALKSFNSAYTKLETNYASWNQAVAPEISLNKIKLEKNSRGLFFGVIGFIFFIALSIGVSVPAVNFIQRQGREEFEDKVVNVIRKGIIPFETQLGFQYGSPEFLNEIEKFHSYVHKRMSFGSIFQEAMPFGSLLLDSNLNMIWANSEFYNNWGIEEQVGTISDITWNYLQKFTNLGEEDPVILAHNQGLAGIYQIQVKTEKDSESCPYEMYVSPVEYSGQTRIMVMFYPLRSIEDSIQAQTKAIIGPVTRTLDSLAKGTFDESFKEGIADDFEAAGIGDLLDSFDAYQDSVKDSEQSYISDIEKLEADLFDQYKLNDDLKKVIEEQGELQQDMVDSLKQTKASIIETLELRGKIEEQFLGTMNVVNDLFYEQEDLLTEAKKASTGLIEQSKVFRNMKALRNDYREQKDEINTFRNLINQEINQLMITGKNGGNWDVIELSLNKIRDDIKKFEMTLGLLAQVMQGTDVSLSKLELIMQQSKEPNIESYVENFNSSKDLVEKHMKEMSQISAEGRECEDTLVGALRDQFTVYKETVNKLKFMQDLLEDNYNSGELPAPPVPEIQANA